MPIKPRKMPIKNLQKISIVKLPEKVRLKVMAKPKLKMAERNPRPNRLDNLMRTDRHVSDLEITYGYNLKTLQSSTKVTLEQIKKNINTTLTNIEKDIKLYSQWELSPNESVALNFLKTNFSRERQKSERIIKEIDEILKQKENK